MVRVNPGLGYSRCPGVPGIWVYPAHGMPGPRLHPRARVHPRGLCVFGPRDKTVNQESWNPDVSGTHTHHGPVHPRSREHPRLFPGTLGSHPPASVWRAPPPDPQDWGAATPKAFAVGSGDGGSPTRGLWGAGAPQIEAGGLWGCSTPGRTQHRIFVAAKFRSAAVRARF